MKTFSSPRGKTLNYHSLKGGKRLKLFFSKQAAAAAFEMMKTSDKKKLILIFALYPSPRSMNQRYLIKINYVVLQMMEIKIFLPFSSTEN